MCTMKAVLGEVMREFYEFGIPLERIVHVNFDDDRLKGFKLEHLRLVGDVHAEMFPHGNGALEK